MNKESALEKHLQEILTKGDFNQLNAYEPETSWVVMSPREQELLAFLFVAEGEQLLKEKNPEARNSFARAAKIAPQNPMVFYRQAMAYAMEENNVACLTDACKALEIAVKLNPAFFEAWFVWGKVLVHMGVSFEEVALLQQAELKFQAASAHIPANDKEMHLDFLFQWGLCCLYHGRMSGEACDFYAALEKFRQASELGLSTVEFWNQYGDATLALGRLMGGKELLMKAGDLYLKALAITTDDPMTWCSLASVYMRLFEHTNNDSCFAESQEAFARAAELDPSEFITWLNWGTLLAEGGRRKMDTEMLTSSIEKFAKAAECQPEHPVLLTRWGEAQMLCGTNSDRIDLLREAESKFIRGLQIDSENIDLWYLYGTCLSELGRYFSDEGYYFQAIEKFEYALTLNPHSPVLWHGCALAHFAIGDMCGDITMLETASSYCARVLEYSSGKLPAQFWNDWGVVYMKLAEVTNSQQHVECAIDKFETALNLRFPGEIRPTRDPEWWYNYGCALDFLGDYTEDARQYEKAINILTQVLEFDPNSPHVRYNLALTWLHLGELTEDADYFYKAVEHFQTLVHNHPEDEAGWNDYGLALIHLAQLTSDAAHPEKTRELYERSEKAFFHAVALGSTQAFYNLACLYSILENYAAAMHYIHRAEAMGVLPAVDDILYDEWLDGLRQTSDFRHFLAQLREATHEE